MSTIIEITVISDKGTVVANDMIERAFSNFNRVVNKFSRFKADSELSLLNNSRKGVPFKVSDELFFLIDFAFNLSAKSKGAFDPTIIDLLELYGYSLKNNFSNLEKPGIYKEIKELALRRHKPNEVKLSESDHSVTLLSGQRIDLGGIGKGYAIDLASKELGESYLINAGGDIRAGGQNKDGRPWLISLAAEPLPNKTNIPFRQAEYGKMELNNQALAASGRFFRRKSFFHHLLDPRTGLPVNYTHQVFVRASSALLADGWATALFITGSEGFKSIPSSDKPLEAMIVDDSGHRLYNF